MKCALLSVGTELLFGQIVNTNTVYLSREMNLMGIDVMYHYTVGDNPERLAEIMRFAFRDCDLIIATGGLGPTQDDLTKETVAQVLHDTIQIHPRSMERLKARYEKTNRTMTENNLKQAWFPSRATVFDNDEGTAPGFALTEDGKTAICMPGPPREMKAMFQKQVKPYLEKRSDCTIYYRMVRTFGLGESLMETKLLELINGQTDPTLATYAKEGECTLRIASKRATLGEAKQAVDEMLEKVKDIIGEFIYSTDDEELYQVVGRKLMERGLTISSAESCTGGLFAKTMTDIPGISAVFNRGIVTYSNQAKMEELGVKEETLDKYGAVSEETAIEMVKGLRRVTGSRVCVSVTGIAGPEGGTPEKPVGLVYIGVSLDDKVRCERHVMRNVSRAWNRNYALLLMLDAIHRIIEE